MAKPEHKKSTHCMVVHAYYPLGESRVERQALALIESGLEVDVICLREHGEAPFEKVEGVNIYRLPVQRNRGAGFIRQLLEYLTFFIRAFFKLFSLHSKRRYNVVQVHNLPDFLVFSAIYPKLTGARIILDLHDLMPEFHASKSDSSMNSFGTKVMIISEQLSCRFADHVITVTELWRQRLIERGVDPKKVSVVMNVADTRHFYPQKLNGGNGRQEDKFHVIYHGTLKEHYGLGDLIRAVSYVRDALPGIRVTIQGVGEYYDEMKTMVKNLGLEKVITINNYVVPIKELPELIGRADVGVVPNRNDVFNGDLLPTKMLEYVALEKPIVAARTRVISYYFDDSTVWFFEPGDAKGLAEGILAASKLRKNGNGKHPDYSRFTSEYNWEKVSRDYVKLVAKLA